MGDVKNVLVPTRRAQHQLGVFVFGLDDLGAEPMAARPWLDDRPQPEHAMDLAFVEGLPDLTQLGRDVLQFRLARKSVRRVRPPVQVILHLRQRLAHQSPDLFHLLGAGFHGALKTARLCRNFDDVDKASSDSNQDFGFRDTFQRFILSG